MICQNCNKELPKGWLFCPTCRAKSGGPSAPKVPISKSTPNSTFIPQTSGNATVQNSGPNYAGFWVRVAAALVDTIILWAIAASIMLFFALAAGWHTAGLITAAINAVITLFYEAYFTSRNWYATPGKRALRIWVADTNLQPIGFGLAMGRSLLKIVNLFTFGLGYLMVAFTDKKQGLHDFMVRTVVIRH